MNDINISVLGFPASGKTTFLAALWHFIESNEIPCTLKLGKFNLDHTHLNNIVECWSQGKEVVRTTITSGKEVVLNLENSVTGEEIRIKLADLSGEMFEEQVKTRLITDDYIESYKSSNGILLFINANKKYDDVSFHDVSGELRDTLQNKESKISTWSHRNIPLQVKIIELLQILTSRPFNSNRRKIAIIISAWDIVQPREIQPEYWLQNEMPMLYQHLFTNPSLYYPKYYGISAQGCDLSLQEERENILDLPFASERIICACDNSSHHDITAPLVWLGSND